MAYNRVVKDLNGLSSREFLDRVREKFEITGKMQRAQGSKETMGEEIDSCRVPSGKGEICMLLDDFWYTLKAKEEIMTDDPVGGLDVSLLQDHLLAPVSGSGIRGQIRELSLSEESAEQKSWRGERIRIWQSLFPCTTSMAELLSVADAGLLMPPKSTWFEPKLRSGLFIHRI